MRCLACDCLLSDREATRKSASTGEFIDLCDADYEHIKPQVPAIENPKFQKGEPVQQEILDMENLR